MSGNRSCKTAKDSRGARIRAGDRVTAISLHDGTPMSTGTIVEMWRQGYDGTILRLDVPPDPQYPHHWSHRASKTIRATPTPRSSVKKTRRGSTMGLPAGIAIAPNPMPDRSMTVLRDGVVIGRYHHKHSGGGYRWTSTVVDGAYGDVATAHLAIVAIVEVSRDRSADVAEGAK